MERAPVTHWIGGWVGPRAVLDVAVKRKCDTRILKYKPTAKRDFGTAVKRRTGRL